MKKTICLLIALTALLAILTACSSTNNDKTSTVIPPTTSTSQSDGVESGAPEQDSHHILIAYFTRLDNTEATLDEIIQGGGPYGSLGDSFESADVDAIASASITVVNGQAQGNVETMAQIIQNTVGGDLFSIQTADSYPVNYDELIDLGGEEKSAAARPELSTQVENMADYDVIFLGYPNWWYDMPMAMYSFLEEYDLSGKTIIPFSASAGSGFSGTISSIQELEPEAVVMENGLHIPMGEVANGQAEIEAWISELGIF